MPILFAGLGLRLLARFSGTSGTVGGRGVGFVGLSAEDCPQPLSWFTVAGLEQPWAELVVVLTWPGPPINAPRKPKQRGLNAWEVVRVVFYACRVCFCSRFFLGGAGGGKGHHGAHVVPWSWAPKCAFLFLGGGAGGFQVRCSFQRGKNTCGFPVRQSLR